MNAPGVLPLLFAAMALLLLNARGRHQSINVKTLMLMWRHLMNAVRHRPATIVGSAVGVSSLSAMGHFTGATRQISSAVTSGIHAVGQSIVRTAGDVREATLDRVQDGVEPMIDSAVAYAGASMKASLVDPAMPEVVRALVEETVDKLMPDVRASAHQASRVCVLVPVWREDRWSLCV